MGAVSEAYHDMGWRSDAPSGSEPGPALLSLAWPEAGPEGDAGAKAAMLQFRSRKDVGAQGAHPSTADPRQGPGALPGSARAPGAAQPGLLLRPASASSRLVLGTGCGVEGTASRAPHAAPSHDQPDGEARPPCAETTSPRKAEIQQRLHSHTGPVAARAWSEVQPPIARAEEAAGSPGPTAVAVMQLSSPPACRPDGLPFPVMPSEPWLEPSHQHPHQRQQQQQHYHAKGAPASAGGGVRHPPEDSTALPERSPTSHMSRQASLKPSHERRRTGEDAVGLRSPTWKPGASSSRSLPVDADCKADGGSTAGMPGQGRHHSQTHHAAASLPPRSPHRPLTSGADQVQGEGGGELRPRQPDCAQQPSSPDAAKSRGPPPALRVAINMLPSPSASPSAAGSGSHPSVQVQQQRGHGASQPDPRSTGGFCSPAGPAAATAASQPASPATSCARSGSASALVGLPTFLGAPAILDSNPPALQQQGSLRKCLSLSRASPDTGPHSQQQQQQPLQPNMLPNEFSSGASRSRAVSGSASAASPSHTYSHTSRSGTSRSLHRSGSYFRVREAVPELDIPGMHGTPRGLPPPPSHPGAVPEEPAGVPDSPAALRGSSPASGPGGSGGKLYGASGGPVLLSPSVSQAGSLLSGSAAAASSSLLASTTPWLHSYRQHNSSHGSQQGASMSIPGVLLSAAHAPNGNSNSLLSGCSSPHNSGGGAGGTGGPGTYSRTGSGNNGSWLRCADAMPPPDMLPIQPRSNGGSGTDPWVSSGLGGGGGGGSFRRLDGHSIRRRSPDEVRTHAAAAELQYGAVLEDAREELGSAARAAAAALSGSLQLPSSKTGPDPPSGSAVAAAAVAMARGSIDTPTSPTSDAASDALASAATIAAARASWAASDCASPTARTPSLQPPSPSSPSHPPQRHTFRTQSKLRLMNLASLGLGLGGGSSSGGGTAAAAHQAGGAGNSGPGRLAGGPGAGNEEQDALLAMLGSTRMLSSVLTVTTGGPGGALSGMAMGPDGSLHALADPRYDPAGHIETIPEHAVPSRASGGLLGNSRMGSTVFSPPQPYNNFLSPATGGGAGGGAAAAGDRHSGGRGRPRAGGWTGDTRDAMLDLRLLSSMGTTVVVSPDGRTLELRGRDPAPGRSAHRSLDLELPAPEEVIAAVNGHAGLVHSPSPVMGKPAGAGLAAGSSGRWSAGATRRSQPGGTGTGVHGQVRGSSSDGSYVAPGPVAPMRAVGGRRTHSARALGGGLQGGVGQNQVSSSHGAAGSSRNSASGSSEQTAGAEYDGALLRRYSAPPRRSAPTSPRAAGHMRAGFAPVAEDRHSGASTSCSGSAAAKASSGGLIAAGLRFLKRALSLRKSSNGHDSDEGSPSGHAASAQAQHAWRMGRSGGDGSKVPPNGNTLLAGDGGGDSIVSFGNGLAALTEREREREVQGMASGAKGSLAAASPAGSRRKLLASQKSFARHSAVMGWVKPEDGLPAAPVVAGSSWDGSTDGEGAGDPGVGDDRGRARATPSSCNPAGRLHTLQELMTGGGGHLTCDAVVDNEVGEGFPDGGGSTRRQRTGQQQPQRLPTGSRRALDALVEDGGAGHGHGVHAASPHGHGVDARRDSRSSRPGVAPPSSPGAAAGPHASSSLLANEDGVPAGVGQYPHQQLPSGVWPPGLYQQTAGPVTAAGVGHHGHAGDGDTVPRLLSRIGSKILRKRSMVVPYSGAGQGFGAVVGAGLGPGMGVGGGVHDEEAGEVDGGPVSAGPGAVVDAGQQY